MQEQINAAHATAGVSTEAARGFGAEILALTKDKKEIPTDLTEKFDKANAVATGDFKQYSRLLAIQEAERINEELSAPAPGQVVAHKGGADDGTDPRGAAPRHALNARERYQRVKAQRIINQQLVQWQQLGVKDTAGLERFRDAHYEAFLEHIIHGPKVGMAVFEKAGFKPQESFALLTTQGDLGGLLAPDEFRAEVIKDQAGFATIRPVCRVERTGAPFLVFPTIVSATTDADMYTSGFTGAWKQEGYVTGGTAPTVQNQPTFGQARIPVHVWAPDAVEITQELLMDSKADIDGILAEVIAETRAMDEDTAFINGSGVNQPMGLLSQATGFAITSVATGVSAAVGYGGLIDTFTNLPSQYRNNSRWLMTSLTYGAILKLEDTAGNPIIPANSLPGMLWGKPILFNEFMPDEGANNNIIIFGDFRYYVIADREELRIQRLIERFAPNIGILATARTGGQVVRTAAFRVNKCDA